MKNSKKGISKIAILIIVVAVLVIAAVVLLLIVNSPKVVINTALDKLSSNINKISTDATYSSITGNGDSPYQVEANLKIDSDLNDDVLGDYEEIQNIINDSDIDLDFKNDSKNEYATLNLKYNYNDKNALDLTGYLDEDDIYIYIQDIFDKYIHTETEYTDYVENANKVTKDDYVYLIDKCLSAFKDNISDEYIDSSKETIDLDGSKVSATKNTLLITEMKKDGAFDDIIDEIKDDTKAMDILTNIMSSEDDSYDTADIEEKLEDLKDSIKNNENDIVLSIYTTGITNKAVMYEVSATDEDGNITEMKCMLLDDDKYDQKIVMTAEDTEIIITSKEVSEDNYDINMTVGEDISINLNGEISDNSIDLDYTLNTKQDSEDYTITGNVSVDTTKATNEITKKINLSAATEDLGTLKLSLDVTLSKLDSLEKENISKSNIVESDELTSTDSEKILTNLMKNEAIADIIDIINDLSSSSSSMYDSDNSSYTYDDSDSYSSSDSDIDDDLYVDFKPIN